MPQLQRILKDRTVRSAAALLVLQVFSWLIPFLTLPYLARVLGPTQMGQVIYWQSAAFWGAAFVEYGFGFSGSREVARDKKDLRRIENFAVEVLSAKTMLGLAVASGMAAVWYFSAQFGASPAFLVGGAILAVAQGMTPLWYFRGMERLMPVVLATIVGRSLATLLTFVLVKDDTHGAMALGLQAFFVLIATGYTHWRMYREIQFFGLSARAALRGLRHSFDLFLISAASSVYGAAGPFIMGTMVAPAQVAFWGASERLNRVLGYIFGTISTAAYPRIAHDVVHTPSAAVRFATALLVFSLALSVCVALPVILFAPTIVNVLFGESFAPAAPLLRVMALQVILTGASRVFGALWMIPLGMERILNRLVIAAAVINVALMFSLVPRYGAMGAAIAFVATEAFVTFGEAAVLLRTGNAFWLPSHRQRMMIRIEAAGSGS